MTSTETDLGVCPVGEDDCDWLHQLAELKQENDRLKLLVTTDPLTGLFNYRYFEVMLASEMERTNRTGRPTCLIMIDLDHFKQVNDEHGHEAGNQALKTAASVFKQELRLFDIVCRYGGEEFALILPQTPLRIAVNVAERVRGCLEKTPVVLGDREIRLTASFGVSIYQDEREFTQNTFVESVDHLMYQAKQQGRNQVCHPDFATLKPLVTVTAEEKSELYKRRKDSSSSPD
jgi:diguanylate cyclase (GGDEF)-like protein